jgi:multiple sugar transport system substrate-binding protein
MTGLERKVSIYSGSHYMLRRYLTPFCVFALGLVFALAFSACDRKGSIKVSPDTATKEAILVKTASPTPASIQAEIIGTPTVLPAIPATPNEKTPSPLGVAVNELRGLQVNLWHPWSGALAATFQGILDDFNRTNRWGVSAQASGFEGYGNLDEAVESALTTGSLPDLVVDYGYQAQHWDGSGVLTDLTPYVTDPVWGFTADEQADFFPAFWGENLVKDSNTGQTRRIGIPYYRSAYVLFYNQSWAEELGYTSLPKTPQDFRVQACTAAEDFARQGDKSNLGKGGYLITPQPGMMTGWLYAFGGTITNPYVPGYLFDTPATSEAFTYLKGLQGSGCAWFDADGAPMVEFANRHALFMMGSLYDIPAQKEAFAQTGSEDEWTVISFPSSKQSVVDTYGPSLLMTRSSAAQQLAAWLVMEWLVYPPNQAKWVAQLEAYPTRQSSLNYLGNVKETSPQWAQALELIPDAHGEPSLASWSVMRWALEDATMQLFSQQFIADQIPELIRNLDRLSAEIFGQVR